MAQYLHLNIYKKSFDFLVKLTQLTSNFQRDFRFTIGEKLNSTTIGFIVLIYKANSAKDNERVEYIVKLLDELQKITVLTRLATELKKYPKRKIYGACTYAWRNWKAAKRLEKPFRKTVEELEQKALV